MSVIPSAIRDASQLRDGGCVRCGHSQSDVHHRQRRREGGHDIRNVIRLCGSGTTGCHGWVHANPGKARTLGYIVPANGRATPDVIPVHTLTVGWVMLHSDGTREPINTAFAMELLAAFGLRVA